MADEETLILGQPGWLALGGQRLAPQPARDIRQHAHTIPFAVDATRAVAHLG